MLTTKKYDESAIEEGLQDVGSSTPATSVSIDLRGNATTNRTFRNPAAAEEITWTKYPTSTTPAVTTSTNGLVRSSTSQTGVTATFAYDGFGRETSATDGRGNVTRTVYDALGRVSSTVDALGHATAYGYDALGRQTSVTDPLTNTVYTAYDSEGHVVSQRGATYPVDYSYDEFGEKISMTTYRDFIGERGTGNGESVGVAVQGDVTRWLRDEATGLVTNKVYADGKGPRYDYTPDGKLATRTWARGIVTTYSYDANGALTNTVYSDGTPTVSLAYNRAGQQIQAADAAGVTTFAYDTFGSLTNETVRSDDAPVVVTNTIERFSDTFGRDVGYALNGARQSTLAYDPATGRLASMLAAGSDTPFTWSYLPGSDLKSSLFDPNGLTASWTYDANGQLLQVRNAFPTNTISQYDYTYDAAGRRIDCAHSGSAFAQDDSIRYGYNARSELTNAVAEVDGDYRYAYDYDDIGNRKSASERGTNSVYAANLLNQYTTVTAAAEAAFEPVFDDDGNQTLIKTATGVWNVVYNGENRPIHWTRSFDDTSIVMSFDRMGRRVRYLETCGNATNENKVFIYDGYLQVGNFDFATHNAQHFVWDPTEPVATRPLAFYDSGASPQFYTHDGNKNVCELVSSSDLIPYTHYEYATFGSCSAGNFHQNNPWRFSSEYYDQQLALVYYNFRHLDTLYGRWLTFDPLGTFGGENELRFTRNDSIGTVDKLGEISVKFVTRKDEEQKAFLIFPRRVMKWIDVISHEDVYVNYARSIVSMARGGTVHSSSGQFSTKVAFDMASCTVFVILSIDLRNDLAEESPADIVYRVTPHKTSRSDGSTALYKDGKIAYGYSAMKGAILAHERGHAKAYLTLVKPEFESEMKNFALSKNGVISREEAKKIVKAHSKIDNKHTNESGRYAFTSEDAWYSEHGFKKKQVGEYYEYSK